MLRCKAIQNACVVRCFVSEYNTCVHALRVYARNVNTYGGIASAIIPRSSRTLSVQPTVHVMIFGVPKTRKFQRRTAWLAKKKQVCARTKCGGITRAFARTEIFDRANYLKFPKTDNALPRVL